MPIKPTRDSKSKVDSKGHMLSSIESLLDTNMSSVSLGNLEKLDLELLQLYQEIAPTQIEINSRMYIFERIKKLIVRELPSANVVPFGSHTTGLIVPSSDIDVNVQLGIDTDKEYANRYLSKIKNLMMGADFVKKETLFHIRKCRIPILKLRDRIFGFRIDISVNQENGVEAAKFIRYTLKEHPYIRVFAILLKHFLTIRNQSDAATGGLNSYSQFLLLLSFFQLHPLVQENRISPLKNIGVLFMDFFQYYGCDFPYKTAKISVNRVGYIRNDAKTLSIEDPTDPDCDVAAVCRNSQMVLEIFRHAFRTMNAALKMKIPGQKSLVSLWFRKEAESTRQREEVRRIYKKILRHQKK
ncbi:DNA polymerase sigma [Encephalitozoon hellem ATCC 50504]|uniref:polynucleotide adenylyltransferase n=1 Tax=Encephalitozoon hellem TaxID=27973 RepID=A0A9Q9F9S2_ENCHE|nr:DNA polymerase sigma [Encephalitozoon hellem ATCC 50504]AFM98520.1 DNA polymerase sigma [Encephalitozoon hellem ATCC 50504]UTX43447.1 poly(A) RNA polymerase [Encephalitozoon hellem]|eukprot:XP_003887501.1 DNA polymerase sigma [Encephalitozoon hellem ATCC 50504]